MKDYRERSTHISCTTSGTRVTLYECPSQCRARVPLIYVTNINSHSTLNIEVYKAATTSRFFLVSARPVAISDFVQFSGNYIVLEPGDRVEVTITGTTPRADATATIEEIFRPTG